MSTRPPLERWSPRALIGFPAFYDQKSLRYVLFTEGFSSFGSPCQVADTQSRHEVLKVVALSELVLAGHQVCRHVGLTLSSRSVYLLMLCTLWPALTW